MEENILRIVQLALAINQAKRGKIRCQIQIHEDGYITLKVDERIKVSMESCVSTFDFTADFKDKVLNYYEPLIHSYFSATANDEFVNEQIRDMKNICHKLGIDTSERYIKVQVC